MRQYFVRDFRHLRKYRADVEHAGDRPQQLHGIFQVGGAVPFESGAPRAFRQSLMRKRNRDVIGDALSEDQLTLRIAAGLAREQSQDADWLALDAHRHAKARLEAAVAAEAVVKDPRDGGILQGAMISPGEDRRLALLCARVQPKMILVVGQEGQVGLVVGNDAGGNRTEPFEDVANVERAGQRGQQLVERVETIRLGRASVGSCRHNLGIHCVENGGSHSLSSPLRKRL